MPIKGVSDKGLDFPEIGRIKKGEMQPSLKNKEVMRPVDLDYFKIEFHPGYEYAMEKFLARYDAKPTSLNIFLPFNDIVEMWDPFLEAYTASRMIAKSDGPADKGGVVLFRCDSKTGETIISNGRNVKTGEIEYHPADNIAGYDYQGKPVEYSPVGRLKVIIPELEEAAYMMMVTGSWNDCENISKQLAGLKELNNGIIKGVKMQLIRSDHEVMAPINGEKKRVTKSLISIKADPDWVAAKIAESNAQAFPQLVSSLHPTYQLEEPEMEILPPGDIIPNSQVSIPPEAENTAEAVIEAPQGKSARSPHDPETLKKNIESTILKYDALLEQDGAKYQVNTEQDGKIIASVVDVYIGGLQKDSLARYAIFTFLLGPGKGSTKTWTYQELGTIKNIWLKIDSFGEALGSVEEEELRQLWNFVQGAQGQTNLFD